MKNLYDELNKQYSLSKTLRFELIPQGKTKENMEKNNFIEKDIHRNEVYKKVKKYCDEYHKVFIDRSLKDLSLKGIENYASIYNIEKKTDKQKQEIKKIQENLRKQIADCFKSNEIYKGLFEKKIIEEYLSELYGKSSEKMQEISEFKRFTTYFKGYNENRRNMYVSDEKSTAIAYRLINENLPIFINNCKLYKKFVQENPEVKEKIYKELEEYIQVNDLDEMFELEYYNNVLTEREIELYNLIISGKSQDNNKKIKGLNEYINEYKQKKYPKLTELYKQILSDKIGISFEIDVIEDDEQLVDMINDFYQIYSECINGTKENVGIKFLINNFNKYDLSKIYVNKDLTLTQISQDIFLEWNRINKCLFTDYDNNYTGKHKIGTEKYEEERNKYFKNQQSYSIKFLDDIIEKYIEDNEINNEKVIENYISNIRYKEIVNENGEKFNIFELVEKYYDECKNILNSDHVGKKELIKDDASIEKIKNLMDSFKAIQEFAKILIPKDNTIERDDTFYGELNYCYEILSEIIPLYNKVRNYLTQKPYSQEKVKLNFENSTLLNGWDVSKERENLGILLTKDKNYYLGIINPSNRKCIANAEYQESDENAYKKIEYKLLPGPNKMLPKVFFSKAGIKEFNPSTYILEGYDSKKHIKGENFDLEFCHDLIDFFKECIKKYASWQTFDFKFSETSQYKDISQFYREVERQGYKIEKKNISEDYINKLVDTGDLFLFQIYNKDFSAYSKGKENLHTMYWKALFDEENLKNTVYKLNGEAEIFYREKSLDTSFVHKKDSILFNKKDKDGMSLGNELINDIYGDIENGKSIEQLKQTYKSVIFKKADYDITKNRRYTVDKFQFHVPITMNFLNKGRNNLNQLMNENIRQTEDIHIIGIDRGERHLLYLTVINSKGEIVEQKSLNEIVSNYYNKDNEKVEHKTNYRDLLDKKEKEREKARESWKTVENIKELKEGYLSIVVHEIVQLMDKYNAIIVLEDLNSGFKNSRIKVEKQVYQKFEKMLIEKLNYIVFKDRDKFDQGGLYNAYQLTNQFESFQKLGKQSGVLFYIPAWCTSKIDCVTGFVNLFYIKYESVQKSKEFISKFDDIKYNKEQDYFEFYTDYSKFTNKSYGKRKNWIICTNSTRIETSRNSEKNSNWSSNTVVLTDEFKKLFEKFNIDYNNLKEDILLYDEKEFFERFIKLFQLTVQLRNSVTGDQEDYIVSPVKDAKGVFFDNRNFTEKDKLPQDADANGAYNIARKGLMLVQRIKESKDGDKINFAISNQDWLTYVQERDV